LREHVARIGEKRYAYRVLVVKPKRKSQLRKPIHMWDDNIKTGLEEIRWSSTDWIWYLLQDRDQRRALTNTVMYLRVA
jgi:hypothetical protein